MGRPAKFQGERTRGSLLLAQTGATQHEIASKAGVARGLVSMWHTGRRRPGKAVREALRAAYAVPCEAWDEPASASAPPPPPAAPPPAPMNGSGGLSGFVEDRARKMASMIDEAMRGVESSTTAQHERVRVLKGCAAALQTLGKMTGETGSVSETRILRSPAWRTIEDVIGEALRPYPEAMRAVGEALRTLHGEDR